MQDVTVPERWTQERRRQHTRDLLLDAAEEVFAKRGYEGASLEEIAETAGYTRGAIYKHFGGKEELFLEANKRLNERWVHSFSGVIDPSQSLDDMDVAAVVSLWREMAVRDEGFLALGTEFNLFLLRNPEARPLAVQQRKETAQMLTEFIEQQGKTNGFRTRIPASLVARVALAASDGIAFAAALDDDDEDLFEAFVQLLVHTWEPVSQPLDDEGDAEHDKGDRGADSDHAVG